MPVAMRRPAAPAMQMLGSSSAPCAATKLHRSSAMRACAHAVLTTPSSMPLKKSSYSVHSPAVMPPAKVAKATPMLFVMIPVEACGFMLTRLCVHISCFSMEATIAGPRIMRWNIGRARLNSVPSAAPARKMATDAATYGNMLRKIRGYSTAKKRTIWRGSSFLPEYTRLWARASSRFRYSSCVRDPRSARTADRSWATCR
jgi:hypothetical protein